MQGHFFLAAGRLKPGITLAAANAQLEQAQIKLVSLQQGRPEDIRNAQASVDSSKAKLAALMNGATDDTRQAA